jgi:plasmid maintenance system antidote protein VapI
MFYQCQQKKQKVNGESMYLEEYLKNNGIEKKEFAKQLDIHPNYLYMILKRIRRPGPKLALKIETLTSGVVGLRYLLFGD